MARPDKYKKNVEPHLNEIPELATYMTEQQIAETLKVSYSAFREYKKKHPELLQALKDGRAELVKDLRSILIKRAKGFQYEESKEIIEDGVVIREEKYHKASLPDVASLNLLLKNYDSENWANDPQMIAIRREEIELQKLKLEDAKW